MRLNVCHLSLFVVVVVLLLHILLLYLFLSLLLLCPSSRLGIRVASNNFRVEGK